MKSSHKVMAFIFLALAYCTSAIAQGAEPKPTVLITNANIFDGTSEQLATGMRRKWGQTTFLWASSVI